VNARALAGAGLLLAAGCQTAAQPPAPAAPRDVRIAQLNLTFRVPASLADLTYRMSQTAEGKPAADFSTGALSRVGGPSCAAGARNSVSSYPIGRIIVSPETPAEIANEAKDNPEDVLGDYLKRLGTQYLYWAAPPPESCNPGSAPATELQQKAIPALRAALRSASVAG